mgnify:CR=1 FL=1
MGETLLFIASHKIFAAAMFILNTTLAGMLIQKMSIHLNRHAGEAMGGRNEEKSLYRKCKLFVSRSIEQYERKDREAGIYVKAKDKMKKSGYRSEYAAAIYLFLKYAATAALFVAAFVTNFPQVSGAFILAASNIFIIETVVAGRRRKLQLKFQRYVYKIYKYLHNQISSGVRVNDAIKTVYEVIDDRELRGILIRFAAHYELTLDIDAALEEFRSSFELQEAETLCVALKQGILTGDNQELLARQEEIMFKKYFYYIQAETDSCRTKGVLAAALFTAVIVIMIIVPLFNDVTDAVSKVFIN